jgi:hypothetical protein
MPPKKQPDYYTIVFEKFIDIMTDADRLYYMLVDRIKEMVTVSPIDAWENSPIPDFTETYIIVNSLRKFLDKKINNPPEEEVKFTTKNNIKDVLMTKEELRTLQSFVITLEEQKALLQVEYNFNCQVN